MKRTVILFLVGFYLSVSTPLSEIWKLPILIEHYEEHKSKNQQLSFIDFLKLHYESDHLMGHPLNHDYEQDQRLPFIQMNLPMNFICVVEEINSFKQLLFFDSTQIQKIISNHDEPMGSDYIDSILHPPQFG